MKKTLALILALVMSLSLLGAFSVSAAEVYDGTSVSASLAGAGTEADPYLIANGADLAYFATNPADGASYKLTADIVWASAPAADNWTPVVFNGTFDGNGHSISGLYIKGAKTAALFETATGTIKNLTVNDSYFEGTKYVGAIVGQFVAGDKKDAMPSLTIENCVSYAEITATKKNALIGAMVGDAFANANTPTYGVITISGCVNYGKVNSTADATIYVGGIVGRVFGCPAIIENCANFGDIEAISAISGGVVGQGGIKGYADADHKTTIINCYNAGNVTAKRICGGIIGRAYPGVEVTNCVNTGNCTITVVDAENDGYQKQLGPITGHGADKVAEEYSNCGPITNCYTSADAVMTNTNDAAATPYYADAATVKTAAELNSDALVTALGDAWAIVDGALALKSVANAGKVESAQPEVTEPTPETTEPPVGPTTGDSAFIFLLLASLSVLGVAIVAKRKEN